MKKDDSIFVQACVEAEYLMAEKLFNELNNEQGFEFSRRYKRERQRIIRQVEKNHLTTINHDTSSIKFTSYKTLRRVIRVGIVAAILLTLVIATAVAYGSFREYVLYEESDFSWLEFTRTEGSDRLYADYTYIPDGYILIEEIKDNGLQVLTYENDKGNCLTVVSLENETSILGLNTEGVDLEDVDINGIAGICCENMGSTTITWCTGKYNHTISGETQDDETLNKEDLIKMGCSRRERKYLGIF